MSWHHLADSLSWSEGHLGKGYFLHSGTIKTWNVDAYNPLDHHQVWELNREISPVALSFEIDPDGGVITEGPSPRVQQIIEADPRLYDAGQRPEFEDSFDLQHFTPEDKGKGKPDWNFVNAKLSGEWHPWEHDSEPWNYPAGIPGIQYARYCPACSTPLKWRQRVTNPEAQSAGPRDLFGIHVPNVGDSYPVQECPNCQWPHRDIARPNEGTPIESLDPTGLPEAPEELRSSPRRFGMALRPEDMQAYVDQYGPYLEHWTRAEKVPGILREGIKPATHPTEDPDESEWENYDWGEDYTPPAEGDVRRNWDGFIETRPGYTYLARPGAINPGMHENHLGQRPYQVPVRIDLRKLNLRNLEADEDNARELWPQWRREMLEQAGALQPGEEADEYTLEQLMGEHYPDAFGPPDARYWEPETQGLADWADSIGVNDPDFTRDSLMDTQGAVAHLGTVPPEAVSLHPDWMDKYPQEAHQLVAGQMQLPFDQKQSGWHNVAMTRTGDGPYGYTNWDTATVAMSIDNDRPLYDASRKLVQKGATPQQLRDWAVRKVIAPYNRDQIKDAQEWNAIPLEERKRRKREHDIGQFGEDAVNIGDSLMQPFTDWNNEGKSDEEIQREEEYDAPDLIDPELVNWDEIHQGILNEFDEDAEYDRTMQERKDLGLGWATNHDLPTNQMRDAFMRSMGAVPEEEIGGSHSQYSNDPRYHMKVWQNIPFEKLQQIPGWKRDYLDQINLWDHRYPKAEAKARQELLDQGLSPEKVEEVLNETGAFRPDHVKKHFPGGKYDAPLDFNDPEEAALFWNHPAVKDVQQNGKNVRSDELAWQVLNAVKSGTPHPYIPQMRTALQQRGYTPEQIAAIMQQQYRYDPESNRNIPLEPPVEQWQQEQQQQQAMDQPGDLYPPQNWISSTRRHAGASPADELKEWLGDFAEPLTSHHQDEQDLVQAPPVSVADDLPYFPPGHVPDEYQPTKAAGASGPESLLPIPMTHGCPRCRGTNVDEEVGQCPDCGYVIPYDGSEQMAGHDTDGPVPGHKAVGWGHAMDDEDLPRELLGEPRHGNTRTATMTLPQEQRAWDQIDQGGDVVGQLPNGYSVRHLPDPPAVNAVGEFMHNCWQGREPERIAEHQGKGFDYYSLHDPHGLPRAAFYLNHLHDRPRIQEVGGMRRGHPNPEHVEALTDLANQIGWEFPSYERRAPGDPNRYSTMTRNQYRRQMAELEAKMGPDKSRLHHQFDNGWAVYQPTTRRDIKRTGMLMGHCWQSGSNGTGDPYVLRDPHGIPRVAWSVTAPHMGGNDSPIDWSQLPPNLQVITNTGTHAPGGHNSSPPRPEHWDMIREWAAAQPVPTKMWHYTGQRGEYNRGIYDLGDPGPNPYWDEESESWRQGRHATQRKADSPITQADATNDPLGKNPAIIPSRKGDPDYLEASMCPNCHVEHRPDQPCPESAVTQYKAEQRAWYDRDPNSVHGPYEGSQRVSEAPPAIIYHEEIDPLSLTGNPQGYWGRWPTAYDPETGTVHVGPEGSTHSQVMNEMPEPVKALKSRWSGWIGHNPESDSGLDPTQRQIGGTEVGWYNGSPGGHIDYALATRSWPRHPESDADTPGGFGHGPNFARVAMPVTPEFWSGITDLYHGTSPEVAQKILQEGLHPWDSEHVTWNGDHQWGNPFEYDWLDPRPGHVYLTTTPDRARNYATTRAEDPRDHPGVVLRIDPTKLDPVNINPDEDTHPYASEENWPEELWESRPNSLGEFAEQTSYGNDPAEAEGHIGTSGVLAHRGSIPPEAISLHSTFHPDTGWQEPQMAPQRATGGVSPGRGQWATSAKRDERLWWKPGDHGRGLYNMQTNELTHWPEEEGEHDQHRGYLGWFDHPVVPISISPQGHWTLAEDGWDDQYDEIHKAMSAIDPRLVPVSERWGKTAESWEPLPKLGAATERQDGAETPADPAVAEIKEMLTKLAGDVAHMQQTPPAPPPEAKAPRKLVIRRDAQGRMESIEEA